MAPKTSKIFTNLPSEGSNPSITSAPTPNPTPVSPTGASVKPLSMTWPSSYPPTSPTSPTSPTCPPEEVISPTSPTSPTGLAPAPARTLSLSVPYTLTNYCSESTARRLLDIRDKNQVEAAGRADQLYQQGRYTECQKTCFDITLARPPGEAIRAKAHQYLADEKVVASAMVRMYNASMAVDLWTAVINRTGQSKYPVEKAIEERAKARQLFVAAESEEEVERMQLSEDK